jgi:hypothetical protein
MVAKLDISRRVSESQPQDPRDVEPSEVEPPEEDEPTPAEDAGDTEEPY